MHVLSVNINNIIFISQIGIGLSQYLLSLYYLQVN